MVELLVSVIVVFIIFALLWWVITLIPWPPAFPVWVMQVILALFLVLVIIGWLLPLAHFPILR